MKKALLIIYIIFISLYSISAQQQIKIMTYNLLNYNGSDTTTRNPYFRTVISSVNPDILVVQEMTSLTNMNIFRTNVMNSFGETYEQGYFINGPDTDNGIFYKPSKFTFLWNTAIRTALRNINEFKLKSQATGDTIRIYSVHLKAGSTSSDSTKRAAEVDSLRKVTNQLPPNSDFIVLGDFNIYRYSEPAFQKLLNQSTTGYFIDPLNLTGTWNNNSSYALYHTQSTRTILLPDSGATGGLDDRFDMILMSQAVMNSGGITYVPGSYVTYGNDSLHFNKAVNSTPTNEAVGQVIADALHYASDHLPVYATFLFEPKDTTITLNLIALVEGLYNGTTMIGDTVKVYLRHVAAPYSKVDSIKIFLNSSGYGTGTFNKTPSGTYYITVTHRNAIETWSKTGGESLSQGSSISYDFTTASSKAYGSNLVLKGSKWCVYSGDVNQDGIINLTDLSLINSDGFNYSTGYRNTDLTGDNFVDINDLGICDNNVFKNITIKKP